MKLSSTYKTRVVPEKGKAWPLKARMKWLSSGGGNARTVTFRTAQVQRYLWRRKKLVGYESQSASQTGLSAHELDIFGCD